MNASNGKLFKTKIRNEERPEALERPALIQIRKKQVTERKTCKRLLIDLSKW